MATLEKKISVDSSFKLKIGETEISLSKEEAEALYSELFKALRKYQPIYRPNGFKPYPDPVIWKYIEPYKVGDFPPHIEVTCKTI